MGDVSYYPGLCVHVTPFANQSPHSNIFVRRSPNKSAYDILSRCIHLMMHVLKRKIQPSLQQQDPQWNKLNGMYHCICHHKMEGFQQLLYIPVTRILLEKDKLLFAFTSHKSAICDEYRTQSPSYYLLLKATTLQYKTSF